ncbi:MAG: hypothetical protein K8U57_27690 [Planctomycetes bacterium]|nr:hypothetical protein [Planctomycetota bacterium]
MRRAASVDENQSEIVDLFRKMGASVEPTHSMGCGFPDLLVGILGFNWLVEVKNGKKRPSERRLTPDQAEWHEAWNGHVIVIETVEQAIAFIHRCREFAIAASRLLHQ